MRCQLVATGIIIQPKSISKNVLVGIFDFFFVSPLSESPVCISGTLQFFLKISLLKNQTSDIVTGKE